MSTHSQRLQAIDALRGLVILIMMVDHVRETFYLHHQVPDPMLIPGTEESLFTYESINILSASNIAKQDVISLTGISITKLLNLTRQHWTLVVRHTAN